MTAALKDFKGAAATVRFDDGGLELEVAADPAATGKAVTDRRRRRGGRLDAARRHRRGDRRELRRRLGRPTWSTSSPQAAGESADDLLSTRPASSSASTCPTTLETLVGDSLAIAVDADFDPSSRAAPARPRVAGRRDRRRREDHRRRRRHRGRARQAPGRPRAAPTAASSTATATATSSRSGRTPTTARSCSRTAAWATPTPSGSVVEHADDAAAVVYVDFDAGDDWLAELAGDDAEVRDNLEPLDALGLSAWVDDDTAHAVLKITTD